MTPLVALSFDDGPSRWTHPLLDVLGQHHAHATFFVLGSNIADHRTELLRAHAEGHEIALHGWDHTPVDTLDTTQLREGIYRTVGLITELGLPEPRWWRPPWDRSTHDAARLLSELGYGYCRATLDGGDVSHDADWIFEHVIGLLEGGKIVGLHDGIARNGQQIRKDRLATVRAVDRLLGHCRSVTVSELLA